MSDQRDLARSLVDGLIVPLFGESTPAPLPAAAKDDASCATCGASYEHWEFDVDLLGRCVLHHVCDPVRIAAFHATHERYARLTTSTLHCAWCRGEYEGSGLSAYCSNACSTAAKLDRERWQRAQPPVDDGPKGPRPCPSCGTTLTSNRRKLCVECTRIAHCNATRERRRLAREEREQREQRETAAAAPLAEHVQVSLPF